MSALKKPAVKPRIDAKMILKKFEELQSMRQQVEDMQRLEDNLQDMRLGAIGVEAGLEVINSWDLEEVDKVLSILIERQEELLNEFEVIKVDLQNLRENFKTNALVHQLANTLHSFTDDHKYQIDLRQRIVEIAEEKNYQNSVSQKEFLQKARLSESEFSTLEKAGKISFAHTIKEEPRYFEHDISFFIAQRLLEDDENYATKFSEEEKMQHLSIDYRLLLEFPQESIEQAIAEVDDITLATALKTSDMAVFELIMLLLSMQGECRATNVRNLYESLGPQRLGQVLEAQYSVMQKIAANAKNRKED